ncbi:MAG TPA: hypothetical protein V6D22_10160 [Candidatus Obscuribacterales bacterium]
MTDQPQQDAEYHYQRLRSWYLASLRANAINDLLGLENKSMTPATLITADSQLIRKLVEEESSGRAEAKVAAKANVDLLLVAAVSVVLVILIVALPFIL